MRPNFQEMVSDMIGPSELLGDLKKRLVSMLGETYEQGLSDGVASQKKAVTIDIDETDETMSILFPCLITEYKCRMQQYPPPSHEIKLMAPDLSKDGENALRKFATREDTDFNKHVIRAEVTIPAKVRLTQRTR